MVLKDILNTQDIQCSTWHCHLDVVFITSQPVSGGFLSSAKDPSTLLPAGRGGNSKMYIRGHRAAT
jgi:hypothetical protein